MSKAPPVISRLVPKSPVSQRRRSLECSVRRVPSVNRGKRTIVDSDPSRFPPPQGAHRHQPLAGHGRPVHPPDSFLHVVGSARGRFRSPQRAVEVLFPPVCLRTATMACWGRMRALPLTFVMRLLCFAEWKPGPQLPRHRRHLRGVLERPRGQSGRQCVRRLCKQHPRFAGGGGWGWKGECGAAGAGAVGGLAEGR